MAVKTTDVKPAEKSKAAEPVEVAPGQTVTEANIKGPAAPPYKGDCVVDDGTVHNGMAVNGGKVCSAHENRYYPDGKKRAG